MTNRVIKCLMYTNNSINYCHRNVLFIAAEAEQTTNINHFLNIKRALITTFESVPFGVQTNYSDVLYTIFYAYAF
jgi:hypothetical protein